MGDRAAATFTVYTCPDQHTANAILALAEEYGFGYEWAELDPTKLDLGVTFTDHECSLGDEEYIANRLQELGVIAEIQQDAKYEYDGTQYYTHPDLGMFHMTGGNAGPLIPALDVERVATELAEVDALSATWCERFYRLTGKAWRDAIALLEKELEETPVTWPYDVDHEEGCELCAAELAEANRKHEEYLRKVTRKVTRA